LYGPENTNKTPYFLKTAKLLHSNQILNIKSVFDFTNANGLKTLQTNLKNKNLGAIF